MMIWILAKQTIPKEIASFMDNIFGITEIRGRVGNAGNVSFFIRSNEANHAFPHLHASYGEFNIVISITDAADILAGNLPLKKQKVAQEWVKSNKEKLLNDWKTLAISASTELTESNLTQ